MSFNVEDLKNLLKLGQNNKDVFSVQCNLCFIKNAKEIGKCFETDKIKRVWTNKMIIPLKVEGTAIYDGGVMKFTNRVSIEVSDSRDIAKKAEAVLDLSKNRIPALNLYLADLDIYAIRGSESLLIDKIVIIGI